MIVEDGDDKLLEPESVKNEHSDKKVLDEAGVEIVQFAVSVHLVDCVSNLLVVSEGDGFLGHDKNTVEHQEAVT